MKEALKLALEALQQIAHVSAMDYEYQQWAVEAITAIKEALAQPEQKRPQNCGTGYCSCIECVMEPPQRTWVSLTDEEIYGIGFDINVGGLQTMKAYKAIEAKLRSKNHD
jgi:hypothetical protein